MKKLLFTFLLVPALFLSAQAQRAGVGLKAGVNMSSINGPDVSNAEARVGYNIGVLANFPLVAGVSLQPEFQVSLQGEGDRGQGDNMGLLYLNIPLMAKVMLGDAFYLQFGPYAGILLNAKQGDNDLKKSFNTFDGGVGLGLGYHFAGPLFADLRYLYGLTTPYDGVDRLDLDGGNRVIQLTLGFVLGGR